MTALEGGVAEPVVSVLMTAYNRERYIDEAIRSVLASTLVNFELIVVDDRSSDRTVEIARSYAGKDARVRVHVNEKNLGDYPNRNRAASLARGRYLKYVDSDDYIYPHGLAVMARMMEDAPQAGYGLACLTAQERPFPLVKTPAEAYEMNYFGESIFTRSPLSAIVRRDVFEAVGGFPEARMVGDFAMWHKLSRSYNVVLMPAALTWYRVHQAQEFADTRRSPLQFESLYHAVSLEALRSERCPLPRERIAAICDYQQARLARRIARSVSRGRMRDAAAYLKLRREWRRLPQAR
jgi:glycosyltransferase involved in cell wall biosynthesis